MKLKKPDFSKLIKEKGLKTLEDVNGLMKELRKGLLESMLEGELDHHLGYEKYERKSESGTNSRNGHSSKKIKSENGSEEIKIPRDRESSFTPLLIPKGKRSVGVLDEAIYAMYSRGLSCEDIRGLVKDMYSVEVSAEYISSVTDSVIEHVRAWQSRPLKPCYAALFLDATFFNLRRDGQIKNVPLFTILGITLDGEKECLGIWLGERETAKDWMSILNELKNRGVKDVVFFCMDGLKGLGDAAASAFPDSKIQRCIVHQIRNSFRYVAYNDRKKLAKDLKLIYEAPTEEEGLRQLDLFAQNWDEKYSYISRSWRENWKHLSTFFSYSKELRKMIYTTNAVESLHASVKNIAKKNRVFPSEISLFKVVFMAIEHLSGRWTKVWNWPRIYSELTVFFPEIIKKYENLNG